MRGPGAGEPTYEQLGPWTVSVDRSSPERTRALDALLDSEPRRRPAPQLPPGWFTPIALAEPDAVHLFSHGGQAPTIYAGVVGLSPPSLAVLEWHPLADPPVAEQICILRSDEAAARLVELIDRSAPVDIRTLAISASPATPSVAHRHREQAISTLVRPNYTMVVGQSPRPRTAA